jgi:hypothetical protein
MRRRCGGLLVAVLLSAWLLPAGAQSVIDTSTASKWYIGGKAGFVLSTVWGPERPWGPKGAPSAATTFVGEVIETIMPGVSFGLNFPIIFHDHFILEPEVLFSTRGTRWEVGGGIDTTGGAYEEVTETVLRMYEYIDVPVLAKLVMLNRQKRFRPVLYLGAQASLCVHSYTSVRGDNLRRSWSLLASDSSSFFDFGVIGGLAVHIRAGRGFFIVDVRGALGLQDVARTDDKILRNIYGTGYISYCFNPKKKKTLW